jgi:hypothetical protein
MKSPTTTAVMHATAAKGTHLRSCERRKRHHGRKEGAQGSRPVARHLPWGAHVELGLSRIKRGQKTSTERLARRARGGAGKQIHFTDHSPPCGSSKIVLLRIAPSHVVAVSAPPTPATHPQLPAFAPEQPGRWRRRSGGGRRARRRHGGHGGVWARGARRYYTLTHREMVLRASVLSLSAATECTHEDSERGGGRYRHHARSHAPNRDLYSRALLRAWCGRRPTTTAPRTRCPRPPPPWRPPRRPPPPARRRRPRRCHPRRRPTTASPAAWAAAGTGAA